MTTIAWDGRFLVTDSLAINGARKRISPYRKLYRINNGGIRAVALCGVLCEFEHVAETLRGKDNLRTYTPDSDTDLGGIAILESGGIRIYENISLAFTEWGGSHLDAMGSGDEYALGALQSGASAKKAVLAVAEHHIYSDDRLQIFDSKTGRITYENFGGFT